MNYQHLLSERAKATKTSPITELFKIIQTKPDLISFAPGTPDINLLPIEMVEPLTKQALANYGRQVLQYGLPQGFLPLREAVLPLLAKRGIQATADDLHISTGSSGALNNIAMVLLDKGDTVLVEAPTYLQAVQDFVAYGANVVEVACDDDGIMPEALEAALKQGGVKFVYLLPTFQNPSGRTMPVERRKVVAELVAKYKTIIIEDDVYYDLRFKGEHLPAVHTFAPDNVIYLGSISKVFIPAVRSGYSVMPKEILGKVLVLKQYIDMYTSWLNQAIGAEYLKGDYEGYFAKLCTAYGQKAAAMQAALKAHMPKGFSWNDPEGGLFVWVNGPDTFDADALLQKAIDADVAFLPGSAFYLDPATGKHSLRLSYASPPADKIDEGVRRLAALL